VLDAHLTPGPGGATPTDLAGIPRDILEEASRRLRLACLVWAGLGTIGMVMNMVVGPLIIGRPLMVGRWPWPGLLLVPLVILVSLGFHFYLRRHPGESERALNLGLVYQVFLAACIGILNQWIPETEFHGVSFIVILILVQPMIVPNSPRRILITSLICALMDPVGVGVAALRGAPIASAPAALLTAVPNFVGVSLAVLQAKIFGSLGRKVGKARELGSYSLVDLIGRGGMGEVWRANHRLLARPAAIKLISTAKLGTANPDDATLLIERFRREAQAAAMLRSPHSISLFDFGVTDEGTFYLVMELLDGIDLETAVKRFGPMPPARVVHILTQVCHSLAEAHAGGMIHRDIKPANLFLCRLGLDVDHVKVLDFGLAKWVAEKGPTGALLTAPDVATGTPAYMAPEMAMGETVDHRADLYALGCVGYWLLTGRLVFPADSAMRAIVQHIKDRPLPPSTYSRDDIPRGLEEAIMACLEKKPEDRPPDAIALSRRLAGSLRQDDWGAEQAGTWWQSHMTSSTVAAH
jgi:serine/threonine-protein kinase